MALDRFPFYVSVLGLLDQWNDIENSYCTSTRSVLEAFSPFHREGDLFLFGQSGESTTRFHKDKPLKNSKCAVTLEMLKSPKNVNFAEQKITSKSIYILTFSRKKGHWVPDYTNFISFVFAKFANDVSFFRPRSSNCFSAPQNSFWSGCLLAQFLADETCSRQEKKSLSSFLGRWCQRVSRREEKEGGGRPHISIFRPERERKERRLA